METVAVSADLRSDVGNKGARDTRRGGRIPGVMYGGGEVRHVAFDFNDIKHAVYTPDFKLVELTVDGKATKCIIKQVQFHPVTDEIIHIDFLELIDGQKVKVEVPVHFEGSAPGLRAGGSLVQKMRRVKIKTTPKHLVSELILDVSNLELGQSVRVRDLATSDGVEILSEMGNPIATVEIPRLLKSAVAEEAAAAAEAEEAAAAEAEAEGAEGEGAAPEGGDEAKTEEKKEGEG